MGLQDYYPPQFLETQFENPKWDSNDFADYEDYNSEDLKTESIDNNEDNDEDFLIENTKKKHKCEMCYLSFTSAHKLKIHLHTVHEGYKDYNCDSCDKSFTLAKSLKRHVRVVHEGLKDFKCESCSKTFAHRHHLKKHMENVSLKIFTYT